MENKKNSDSGSGLKSKLISSGLLLFAAAVTVGVSYVMYQYTQKLLHERLQERLVSITSTATLYFSVDEMNALRELATNKQDDTIYDSFYKDINSRLNDIRDTNHDIQYVYLFGKTDDPYNLLFLADADVNEELILEEGDEGNDFPGSMYDVSEIVALQYEAFKNPTADEELYIDEWGETLSSYAPIVDPETGEANAVLGIDVDVSDYIKLVNATFLPFLLFIILLLVLLSFLTFTLVRMWESRVTLFKELDRQKDELLSIVSHQLATPVSSMKWYLEMMLDGDVGKLTKEQTEHVESLQLAAGNLSDLVSMILDVSRIQLGKMKVTRTDLDLNDFFKEILTIIDPKAAEKGVDFVKNMPEKLPIAMLDKRLMRMTLENLLSNAVKYTPKGGKVTLDVKVQGDNLYYTVKDTGCGIPKEEQGQVFGKLFRATNVQKVDGNGFGLYVAKGAVESQGGTISFSSAEKKGATFKVALPLLSAKKEDKKK